MEAYYYIDTINENITSAFRAMDWDEVSRLRKLLEYYIVFYNLPTYTTCHA